MRAPAVLVRTVARTLVLALAALLVLGALTARAQAQPDTRKQARAAFARATAAEERKDWKVAIREYLNAYELAPHADVLYNIASVYERLEELRSAATYYRRYLDESATPDDRARVERLIDALRMRTSKVTVRSTPAGATILVDGERRGRAPLELLLPGGRHQISGELDGATTTQLAVLEYAEPATVALVLGGDGQLVVSSNEPGATVTIDDRVVGVTPWRGPVAAGRRRVVVSKAGFATHERSVEIPPGGTSQISASMVRPLGFLPPAAPSAAPRLLFGGGGGALLTDKPTLAFEILAGYRPPSRRWDVYSGLAIGTDGVGYALGMRLFVLTGRVRPYAGLGFDLIQASSHGRAVAGVLLADLATSDRSQIDLYVEGGAASIAQVDGARLQRAVFMVGALWHLGGDAPAGAATGR